MRRHEMAAIRRAAQNRWDTPPQVRKRSVEAVQAVLDNPRSTNSMKRSARLAMAAMQKAGWVELVRTSGKHFAR